MRITMKMKRMGTKMDRMSSILSWYLSRQGAGKFHFVKRAWLTCKAKQNTFTTTTRVVTRKGCKETISSMEDILGRVLPVLGAEVLVATAGGNDPAVWRLVTHPVLGQPRLDTTRRGQSGATNTCRDI